MNRSDLDQKIQYAKDQILLLGSMVEEAMYRSVRALKDHDFDVSQSILEKDIAINRKRFEVESAIISSIATQQPLAHDLRILASVLDLCTELERIGDYAKGIAVINLRSNGLSLPKILNDLYYMSEKALDMFHRAMTAFVQEDAEQAQAIAREDDVIDALYEQVYNEVMDLVTVNPMNMERGNYVLWVAHNLERMADRVTNICERTVFIATGDFAEVSDAFGHHIHH
jgi:phosphate transport system protein